MEFFLYMDQTIKTHQEILELLKEKNPKLTKSINGVQLDLEESEYLDTLNSWAISEYEAQFDLNKAIDGGFKVEPENFILALCDNDRLMFTQMLSLVKEALDLGLITNDSPQIISDKFGQKHELTTLRFRQIMVQYGMYYKGLWGQLTN